MRRIAAVALVAVLGLQTTGCARAVYNFGEIHPNEIYRSGQPSPLFLRWVVERKGIKTLVNLRGKTPGYESAFAARNGLRIFTFNLSASRPPSEADVERFLAIMRDPGNHPLLVHCRNGVDRTGYMLALLRMQDDGWGANRARREMNRFLQFSWLNAAPQQVVSDPTFRAKSGE